jgi:hypothetical protein
MEGTYSTHGGEWKGMGAHRALLGKPEGKSPHGRPRRRWEDLQAVGWMVKDWIDLAQNKGMWRTLVYAVMNLRVP